MAAAFGEGAVAVSLTASSPTGVSYTLAFVGVDDAASPANGGGVVAVDVANNLASAAPGGCVAGSGTDAVTLTTVRAGAPFGFTIGAAAIDTAAAVPLFRLPLLVAVRAGWPETHEVALSALLTSGAGSFALALTSGGVVATTACLDAATVTGIALEDALAAAAVTAGLPLSIVTVVAVQDYSPDPRGAVARLMLDNISHLKAYWPMLGVQVAQAALSWGADDVDGTVREERIYHMAGAKTPQALSRADLIALIHGAGRVPVERDTLYHVVAEA
jgi:hypothetical protein